MMTYAIDDKRPEELLANFVREYVQPYLVNNTAIEKTPLRIWKDKTTTGKSIEDFIRKRVDELKPFLQDDDVIDDKLTLEGEDETTVVEFFPKLKTSNKHDGEKTKRTQDKKAKDFQENINKYKKLRSKIRKALKREKVTNKTRSLITKTLDKMIAQIIEHKCSDTGTFRGNFLDSNIADPAVPAEVINSWNDLWHKLKDKYQTANTTGDVNEQKKEFLKKFQDLVAVMTRDLHNVIGKYKVVCRYEGRKKDEMKTRYKNIIRTDKKQTKKKEHNSVSKDDDDDDDDNNKDNKDNVNSLKPSAEIAIYNSVYNNKFEDRLPCTNFKICSDELKEFLLDFYINLNDTAVNTIETYSSMFLRDVNDDLYHEKERVVKLIDKITQSSEKKVDVTFRKQTKKLKLDKDKNQYVNVKALYNYVSATIGHLKRTMHKEIKVCLKSVKESIMLTIQKDIDVNMALDLDNLERDVSGRICQFFEVCNSRVFSTRRLNSVSDKNNVYVKVQVNLEDYEDTRRAETTTTESATKYKQYRVMITKAPFKFNVTRTPFLQRLVYNNEQSSGFNDIKNEPYIPKEGHLNNSKDSETRDFNVKIIFTEEKEDKEAKSQQKKLKRSELRVLRRAEYLKQLVLDQIFNQDNNTNNTTKIISKEYKK